MKGSTLAEKTSRTTPDKWVSRENEALCTVFRKFSDLVVKRTEGIEIESVDGRKFLDFTGGAHACNVGYSHPKILKATKDQLEKLDFLALYNGLYPLRVELAEKLKKIAPGCLRDGKVAYCNDGSEATEFSIKLARYTTKRPFLLACFGAYHGGTMGALSLTLDSSDLRARCSPFLPGVMGIPYANCYRCVFGQEYPSCGMLCIGQMEYLFKTVVEPQEVAAIFIEPIQAHGGVIVPPNEYFLKMKKICSEFGILIIDDEVVTGFGRTGRMFGIQHFGMEPDVMYFGKPIAAGMPLGAILARKELMDNWVSHGPASTLAANLLSCARASALIDILQQEKLVQNAAKTGTYFLGRMKELAERFPIIGDVRGKGLLIGIELVKNAKTKEPAQNALKSILQDSFKKGLLFSVSGLYKNVIKFSPPLILTTDQVDKAIDIIEYSLKQLPKCH